MTQRMLDILNFLAIFYVLTREQLQYLLEMDNPRVVRRILRGMHADKLIGKTRMEGINPRCGAPAPVYFPAWKGIQFLAEALCDERLLAATCRTPDWMKLYHWVNVSQFHIFLREGMAASQGITIEKWISEWEVCDPLAKVPQDKFTLFTLVEPKPRLVLAPDAGFLVAFGRVKLVIYLELDRATSSIALISASKTPAVPLMLSRQLHHKHFPETTEAVFRILHVTTSPQRCELLRKGIATRDGSEVHRFVSWQDWEREKSLSAPIFFTCDKGPEPLIKAPHAWPAK